ncbi:hypothetical protein [Natrinema amylolyticum]|uniref:hypothetical protein n=1 Tax=Natrinema amylolyticum TaxID=2878679 RepID=UPI001CFB1AD9|nr:hypothetical protein [Natrinema amylolyticum]
MQFRTVIVVAALVVASVAVGSAAFTSGTVDRTANVNVVGDSAAVTGLAPGSASAVYTGTNGELQIDFSNYTNAEGVNGNATYTIGDSNAANETYAFNVTNNDDVSHDYTLSYDYDNSVPTNSSVSFSTYDNTGAGPTDPITLSAGETAYVVTTVNTTDATSANDLSGTLNITAT